MIIEITPTKAFIIATICAYFWWVWAVNGKG